MSFLLGATSTQSAEDNSSGKGKFEHFKKEPQLHYDENALLWWKTNQERFPVIAKSCASAIVCPCNISAIRKDLSTAGLIVSNLRSSLKPENTDMLIFFK